MSVQAGWPELKQQLLELMDLPESERRARVALLRETQPDQAAELEVMLSRSVDDFLEVPAWQRVAAPAPEEEPPPPARIGPWSVEQEIGRGGMGRVFRGRRVDGAFEQRTAIKIVRPELASPSMSRRFLAERRILAGLEHPGIARLLDGGATPDGTPYLVLEYVDGVPIDTWCNERSLPVRDRLELFVQVCAAVNHAHQRLVLHRDIKTANVLVDASGQPKLLDFGIAKLISADDAGGDLTVLGGARPLTPEWASPEQLRGEPLSTASDVYSLGVLLHVLLTGRRPHGAEGLSAEALARRIEAGPDVSIASRRADTLPPGVERRALRGDLERIVARAVAGEVSQRYATVAALSADVSRHLAGRPVEAHPRTLAYRIGKLVRRNRVATVAVAAAVVGLVGATVFSLHQAAVAERERARAERRFNDVRKLAKVVLFDLHDAIRDVSGAFEARKLLVNNSLRYLDDLAREAGDEPELLTELSQAYERIATLQGMPSWPGDGTSSEALASTEKALEFRKRAAALAQPGELAAHQLVEARMLQSIGWIRATRGETRLAIAAYEESNAILDKVDKREQPRERLVLLATNEVFIGDAQRDSGDPTSAQQMYEKAAATMVEALRVEPSSLDSQRRAGVVEQRLGDVAAELKQWSRAQKHFAASLATDEVMLKLDPKSLEYRRDLGTDLSRVGVSAFLAGKPEEALAAHLRALAVRQELLQADPKDARGIEDLAETEAQLAKVYWRLGKRAEARANAQSAFDRWRALLRIDPDNVRWRHAIAGALLTHAYREQSAGDTAEALASAEDSLERRERLAREKPDYTLNSSRVAVTRDAVEALRGGRPLPPDPDADSFLLN